MNPVKKSLAPLLVAACLACAGEGNREKAEAPPIEELLERLPPGVSNVQVAKANLDGDALEEFTVCYDESAKGVVLTIMGSTLERRFVLSVDHDHATLPRIIDIDHDSLPEVVLEGPSRGGESLQVIRSGGGGFALVGDFWGLEVNLVDEDGDGALEVEVENRDFERDPSRHTVHTFYRWDGAAFSPFKSFRATRRPGF